MFYKPFFLQYGVLQRDFLYTGSGEYYEKAVYIRQLEDEQGEAGGL